jgi:hypothetical protein
MRVLCSGCYKNLKPGTLCDTFGRWFPVAYPQTFSVGNYIRYFFLGGDSTNSVEDRGQREWETVGGSHLISGYTQFANE